MTVIQSYNNKNTPTAKLYAVKIAEAVFLYIDLHSSVAIWSLGQIFITSIQINFIILVCFFYFRFSKMYSLNLSLENTQGLYVFGKLKIKRKKNYKTNLNWIFKKIRKLVLNLRRNLHLFLDNMEPRTENCFENVASDWAKNDLICP